MHLIYILFLNCIIFLSNNSFAEEISVIDLMEKQLKIIEEQNKKIKNLENLVNELSKKINNMNSGVDVQSEKDDNEVKVMENTNESEIGSSSSQKIYNPEKAFFGPLQPLKSKDGNYTAGFMGLVQLDWAIHDQQANYNNNNDLSDGFIVRRAVLTLAGLSEKDWIWFLSYNYANEGDYPKNGLGAAMAI